MDLVRDVLDKQLVDRKQVKMGKVDGLVLETSMACASTISSVAGASHWCSFTETAP
jgi:hypothetical protein